MPPLDLDEALEQVEEAMAQLSSLKEGIEDAKKVDMQPVRFSHRTVLILYDRVKQGHRFDSQDWGDVEDILRALCEGRLCVGDKQTSFDEKLPSDGSDE